MNIDLPAYFLHRTWKKDWLFIKGPTSKYHHEEFYTKVEELAKSGKPQTNIISWFGFLERSCGDPKVSTSLLEWNRAIGSGENTLLDHGWGHPTFFIYMGEDTLSALWVRTPSRQPGWGHLSGDSLPRLVTETLARLELST